MLDLEGVVMKNTENICVQYQKSLKNRTILHDSILSSISNYKWHAHMV